MNCRNELHIERDEIIVTARCRLRYPELDDIPHIWSACKTPGFNDGLPWEPPANMAGIERPFEDARERWTSGDEYSFVIESRAERDFIGWVSIRREPAHGQWSIGFWVHPARQRQGFATECAAAVLDLGFSRLGARLITAAHAAWNVASGVVLERIGMTRTCRKPKGFRKNGAWVEELVYEARAPAPVRPD